MIQVGDDESGNHFSTLPRWENPVFGDDIAANSYFERMVEKDAQKADKKDIKQAVMEAQYAATKKELLQGYNKFDGLIHA